MTLNIGDRSRLAAPKISVAALRPRSARTSRQQPIFVRLRVPGYSGDNTGCPSVPSQLVSECVQATVSKARWAAQVCRRIPVASRTKFCSSQIQSQRALYWNGCCWIGQGVAVVAYSKKPQASRGCLLSRGQARHRISAGSKPRATLDLPKRRNRTGHDGRAICGARGL